MVVVSAQHGSHGLSTGCPESSLWPIWFKAKTIHTVIGLNLRSDLENKG